MPLIDALLPEFDHEMTVTRKLLERVPEDRFDFKPHQKSYSLGQLAQHVATVPMWGAVTINQSELDLGGSQQLAPVANRAELLALFDGHVAGTRAALVGKSDAELMAPWTLKVGGRVAIVRDEPSHSSPRPIERLPENAGREAAIYVRSHRRRESLRIDPNGSTGRRCESATVRCEGRKVRNEGPRLARDLRTVKLDPRNRRTGPSHLAPSIRRTASAFNLSAGYS